MCFLDWSLMCMFTSILMMQKTVAKLDIVICIFITRDNITKGDVMACLALLYFKIDNG